MVIKASALAALLASMVSAHPQLERAAPRAVETTCTVETTTVHGLETPIPNVGDWYGSMYEKYATATQFTGENIRIHTMVMTQEGFSDVTGYHALPSDILEAEGVKVTNSVVTTTSCGAPKETGPPEEVCDPHGDHWHCPEGVEEPENPPTKEQLEEAGETEPEQCAPHGDHWHCPEGVDEPDFPPSEEDFEEVGADSTECIAHEDHWHCPPGVEEPSSSEESSANSSGVMLSLIVAIVTTMAFFNGR